MPPPKYVLFLTIIMKRGGCQNSFLPPAHDSVVTRATENVKKCYEENHIRRHKSECH